MTGDPALEDRFARFVEHHVLHGICLPIDGLCEGREDLVEPLKRLVATYLDLAANLERGPDRPVVPLAAPDKALPTFQGFRTVERLGGGGMGEVFKLQDLTLDRFVAAKVVRRDTQATTALRDFLHEARAMALFQDPRIAQIFEFRHDAEPPVIIMEFVDGFELGRVAPSLEFRQRARILEEVCEAIHHAHLLGIQHRDLKPTNIMLDARLSPKILDFGLSAGDPARGHLRGTPPYLAPEQLDPGRVIDVRTDVYALGVVLYEMLCGAVPYGGSEETETLEAIRRAQPRLPVEIDSTVPEPLQAIALKAMDRDPSARYQSAKEMALDLRRYLDGRPVLARPGLYQSALTSRLRPHLDHIEEWLQLRLIYPHEAVRLKTAYRDLEAREDDWIVVSRALSYSKIALYLGAFLLVAGSLFYFGARRIHEVVSPSTSPFIVLGLPFLGLNLAAHHLYRKDHRAVAVAFYLAGVGLLPLFLLILFYERGLFVVPPTTAGQLFTDAFVSNRQLQVTILISCAWSLFLALRTRTAALSTVFTVLGFLFALAVLADYGLREWVVEAPRKWDLLALHLSPLILFYGALGYLLERSRRPWFGRPLYVAAALTLVLVLELLAQNGKAFAHLGLPMQRFQGPKVSDPLLLDTLTAMTLNGVAMYWVAVLVNRHGSEIMRRAGSLLFVLSPFAALKPLGYLSMTDEYSHAFDWIYLGLALGATLLSHQRQRKSFYYAGVVNAGWALWVITKHNEWFDKPLWATLLIAVGLLVLVGGFGLDMRERLRRRRGGSGSDLR